MLWVQGLDPGHTTHAAAVMLLPSAVHARPVMLLAGLQSKQQQPSDANATSWQHMLMRCSCLLVAAW